MRRRTSLVVGTLLGLVLAACGSTDNDDPEPAAPAPTTPSATSSPAAVHEHKPAKAVRAKPLRKGERFVDLKMSAPYSPSAPTGVGTDDYRCFLLDPKLDQDAFITGTDVLPGNPDVVHHVILFRVPAKEVAAAEDYDRDTEGDGWTCFGNAGLNGSGQGLDDAPWLGAWAPGGGESMHQKGYGVSLAKGDRIVMQVHYNLLAGASKDVSATRLRVTPASAGLTPLETMLLPAPVELPCRAGHTDSPLCDRATALADVKKRFGEGPGSTADLLHLLCGGDPAGSEQSCTRNLPSPMTIRGVAGHMHLLGRKIRIEVNPGTPKARTVLDIPLWNFDDQAATAIPPVALDAGDTVKVTCRHVQWLRDQLPSFEGKPDRYVLWGEGTTDEMCLGILQVTRP